MRVNWGSDELFNDSSFCEDRTSELPSESSNDDGAVSAADPSAQQRIAAPSPGCTPRDDPPPPRL